MAIDDAAKAVKTVIVKGLGKIKFPASMSDDAISKALKNVDEKSIAENRVARQMYVNFKRGNYDEGFYGVRTLPDEQANLKVGDNLPDSYVWDDGNQTDEVLDGSSTIGVGDGYRGAKYKDFYRAVKQARDNGYQGNKIALVGGDHATGGEDIGEHVIRNAKILGIFDKNYMLPLAAGIGATSSLISPESQANEQRAISRLSEMGQSRPTGTIQAAQNPLLGRAANALLSFQTPLDPLTGPQFQNTANLLQKFNYGDPRSYWDYFNANLDWM